MKRVASHVCFLLLACLVALPARAHVGSKDVFEQVTSGPYHFFVTVRPPTVVPGVATLEVRTSGAEVRSLTAAPMPLTGEASRHPPTPDTLQRSTTDPAFFTGSLWLMAAGSWQVRLSAQGQGGPVIASVPVPAMALTVQRMSRPLGLILGLLGLLLTVGFAAVIWAAVREARLPPGVRPTPERNRRAAVAGIGALAVLVLLVSAGDHWWNVEAADYSADIFHPLHLQPQMVGSVLYLHIDPGAPDESGHRRSNEDLLPDHGHLMHLYAIRWPEMDAVYHLHPTLVAPGEMRQTLPSMPPGTYHLYGDIVHRSGFPETLTANLKVPADASHYFVEGEDASAYPEPLSKGDLGDVYKLPDGYTMTWQRPAELVANRAEIFHFELLNAEGKPATDVRPYLGMAGHAAFVKTDGSVFAHTHPDGSAAMPAMMLANASGSELMASAMAAGNSLANTGVAGVDAQKPAEAPQPLAPEVNFPYGFPSPGRYRIFVQIKHGDTVETGVFDAEVS